MKKKKDLKMMIRDAQKVNKSIAKLLVIEDTAQSVDSEPITKIAFKAQVKECVSEGGNCE